jgi:hypothetical protein
MEEAERFLKALQKVLISNRAKIGLVMGLCLTIRPQTKVFYLYG